jgi:predicted MPP superfamily phosphohydrolase
MSGPVSIIHLSDLHISSAEFSSQSVVLQALWEDIARHRKTGFTPDLVFFTGDLIARGDYNTDNLTLAREQFIAPLMEAAELPLDRFFMVPGNHDVQLSKRHRYVTSALDAISSQDQVRDFLLEARRDPVSDGLEGFNALVRSIPQATPVLENSHFRAYQISLHGLRIGVCAINSSWRASGRPNNADYGHLIIGRQQLDELIEAVKSYDLVLGLFHHPPEWLALFDSAIVRRHFLNHFDGVFYGHNHEVESTLLAGSFGSYFASNAGCLYQHRDYFNGYSHVTYSPGSGTWSVDAREYFETRHIFDAALRFAPNGRQAFHVPKRNGATLAYLPTAEFISAVSEAVNVHLLPSIISDVAPKSLRTLFVDPPLSHLSQRQMQLDRKTHDPSVYISLKDIYSSMDIVVFIGPKQSGKTTLLHRICLQSADAGLLPFPAFCGYVDLRHSIDTESKVLDALLGFSSGTYRRAEFLEMLQAGSVAICFDNLHDADARQLSVVKAFVKDFPKCRYFFSILEKLESSLSPHALPDLGVHLKPIYIHSFGRRETRALTARWFGGADAELAAKVEEIMSSLVHLNIPRTPFLISALLWIKESNLEFTPVNRGAILDALIDGVLEKLTESKTRGSVDSTIKRHFLSALAEFLYRKAVRSLTFNELDSFAATYFTNRALNVSSGPFLAELQTRGMLLQVGDHICFKFDCIRAYFLAQRLRESGELLKAALTPEEFLSFSEELDYFSGASRDNSALLKRCLELLAEFRAAAALNLELEFFDDVSINESPFRELDQAGFTDRILGSRLEGEKREELLDRLDHRAPIGIDVQDPKSPPAPTEAFPRFVAALQATSAVLRNSELIEDAALKHEAYAAVADCWAEALIAILIAVDFLADDATVVQVIASLLPVDHAGLATYFLKVIAPNVILTMALESLGTPKLEVVIEKAIAEDNKTVREVLDAFLYFDLNLAKRFQYIEGLLKRHRKNRFVSELVFFKLAQAYLLKRLSEGDEKAIRALLREALETMFANKDKGEKDLLKNRVIASFEKKRLLKGAGKDEVYKPEGSA